MNSVNFFNVEYVEQKKLPLFTKEHEVAHYIFVDGRPEKNMVLRSSQILLTSKRLRLEYT